MKTYTGSAIVNDNTDPTNYPKGRMKNNTTETSNDGTPLYSDTLDDTYQAHVELLRLANITPSEATEKKAASQIADAIGFLAPVMIIKCGYDSTVKVLGGTYKAGYTAAYTTSLTLTGAVANKLTINKNAVLSTENYYVDVIVASSAALKEKVTVGASHSNGANGYFDNDDSNIYISGNGGSYSDADLQKVNIIIKVFKA